MTRSWLGVWYDLKTKYLKNKTAKKWLAVGNVVGGKRLQVVIKNFFQPTERMHNPGGCRI